MSDETLVVAREVAVRNKQGMHARPVMRFVDLASKYRASVTVANISRRGEMVDGKSAMHMLLLEATQGNVLRIEATGEDATATADALVALVEASFHMTTPETPSSPD